MKMRRLLFLSIVFGGFFLFFVSTGWAQDFQKKSLNVLCSFLPMYVFTSNITKDVSGVAVTCLLPADLGCPHDYALTPHDVKRIAGADVLIVNGLGMESFLGEAVEKVNPHVVVIESSRAVEPLKNLETVEWHQTKRESRVGEINPHTWVSLSNAIQQVSAIAEGLVRMDPAHAAQYRSNARIYSDRLKSLLEEFQKTAQMFKVRHVVTVHNVFSYFFRDLDVKILAMIEETAGQEPSAGELKNLVEIIRSSGPTVVFSEPQYPERVACVLAEEAHVPLYSLDPVASGEFRPDTYEKVMRKNLKVLKKALGG